MRSCSSNCADCQEQAWYKPIAPRAATTGAEAPNLGADLETAAPSPRPSPDLNCTTLPATPHDALGLKNCPIGVASTLKLAY